MNPRKGTGWLYARQAMLTFHGDWGVLPSSALPPDAPLDVVVGHARAEPSAAELWTDFKEMWESCLPLLRPRDWAYSQEVCTKTWAEKRVLRVHFHVFFRKEIKMWIATPEMLTFRGSVPYKSEDACLVSSRTHSGHGGMYYLTCPKLGMLRSASSKERFTGFPVNPTWIANLVSAQKMSVEQARDEFVNCGAGLVRRLADLDKLMQCRREKGDRETCRVNPGGALKDSAGISPVPGDRRLAAGRGAGTAAQEEVLGH